MMGRFLLKIDELKALVHARATLEKQGEQEHADVLGRILRDSVLDD